MHLNNLFSIIKALDAPRVDAALAEAQAQYAAAEKLPEANKRIEVLEDRLKKAMEREANLIKAMHEAEEKLKEALAELETTKQKMQEMLDHPAVRAAEALKLKQQRDLLDKKISELMPKESKQG